MTIPVIYVKIKRRFAIYKRKISQFFGWFHLWINNVDCEGRVLVTGRCFIHNNGQIKIGKNVSINSGSWTNPIGGNDRTYFQIGINGKLTIGSESGISNTAITALKSVDIGNNVLIGAGCKIYDTDFHPINHIYRYGKYYDNTKTVSKPIVIEDGAFIGGHSIILKGSHIGKNSIIGAGSVVSGNIPANQIWGGNPAKLIRELSE